MCELFEFQAEGVQGIFDFYSRGNHGVILGDQMGLGKTVQALAYISQHRPPHVLVVCPASVKLNWKREALKWLPEDYTIHLMDGRKAVPFTPGWPLVSIVNYDILSSMDFSQCEYDLVVYDEAHMLKTPDAKRTAAAAGICTSKRLLMTGTPIINRPQEIWQLMLLCGLCRPEEFHQFGVKYCDARQRTEWKWRRVGGENTKVEVTEWDYSGASNLEELNYWLRKKCLIRRMKKDVLTDLPEKTRQIIELECSHAPISITEKLRELCDRKRELVRFSQTTHRNYDEMVAQLNDEIRLAFEEVSLIRHETALEKMIDGLAFIMNALETTDKLFVAAYHRDVIEELAKELWHAGMKPVQHHGGMTGSQKQASLDAFINDPSCRVIVGQLQATGVGVNGLQGVCSHLIVYELPWSPSELTQLEDRLHRYGQHDNVLVQHLVYNNSIDARMAKVLVKKQKIIETAIDVSTEADVDWLSELGSH
jgi:SNF2 family DNA or RNA helicase